MTANGETAHPRILIVEDNYLMAETIGDLVRRDGFEVAATVGHVDKALRLVAEHEFDGAIVDINLHGASSVPVCAALSERKVPYIFLTGYDTQSIVPPEYRGASWLTKPVDKEKFRAALFHLAPRGARQGQVPSTGNAILELLSPEQWSRLESAVTCETLNVGQVLERAGEPPTHLYFPAGAVISILGRAPNGKAIEVGMVGRDGAIGASLVLGGPQATADAIVRFAGTAWRLSAADAAPILAANRSLHGQLLRFFDRLQGQFIQTAVVAGHVTIERRVARWLLLASSRTGGTTLAITHRSLAEALAVRRAGVTRALHELEGRELIKAGHRSVTVIDRDGLLAEMDGFYADA